MRKTRTLIITAILVVVLGLLTISMALAGPNLTADSLVSVTGGPGIVEGQSGAVPERGGTLLLNQAPNQTNGFFADADCGLCGTGQQSIAENFVLNDTYDIEVIVIWSGYFPGNSAPVDNLTVIFHENSGSNLPGTVIATEANVPSTRTQTGVILFGVNEWMTVMTLTNPVQLTAGTYWVEIFNNTAGNTDNYFWEVGNLDATNGILNSAFSTSTPGGAWNTGNPVADLATQIYGTLVTPEVPDIAISKNPASQTIVTGGNADFTITVTNTGDVALANVNVSDPLVPDCDNAIGALAISQTVSYACQDTGVAASYTNVATVTSQLDTGAPGPSATASADVTVVPPTSVSLSGFGGNSTALTPIWVVAILLVAVGFGLILRRKLTA